MTTLLYTHEACLAHDPGPHHPESPARLQAVLAALAAPEFAALDRREAPEAALDDIERVHPRRLIDALLAAVPKEGYAAIDGDTIMSPGFGRGGAAAAGRGGRRGRRGSRRRGGQRVLRRAPARPSRRAAAADGVLPVQQRRDRRACGRARCTVSRGSRSIDFDVHHGNGTEARFAADPTLFYASTHQSPLYPGTGAASDVGVGNIVNLPLRPMSGSREFRQGMSRVILPALEAFAPEMVLISAGIRRAPGRSAGATDARRGRITPGSPSGLWKSPNTTRRVGWSRRSRAGYDLTALGASAAAHVRALMAA